MWTHSGCDTVNGEPELGFRGHPKTTKLKLGGPVLKEMKILKNILAAIEERTAHFKKQILIIHFAYKDSRIGLLPKVLIFVAIGYALSPIDLIPDFIPILGLLDDIVILPVIIAAAIKLIPPEVIVAARQRAEEEDPGFKKKWFFVPVIISIWILCGIVITRWILQIVRS